MPIAFLFQRKDAKAQRFIQKKKTLCLCALAFKKRKGERGQQL